MPKPLSHELSDCRTEDPALSHGLLPLSAHGQHQDRHEQASGRGGRHGKVGSSDHGHANCKSFWVTLLSQAALPARLPQGQGRPHRGPTARPCLALLSLPAEPTPLKDSQMAACSGCFLGTCAHTSGGVPGSSPPSTLFGHQSILVMARHTNTVLPLGHLVSALRSRDALTRVSCGRRGLSRYL